MPRLRRFRRTRARGLPRTRLSRSPRWGTWSLRRLGSSCMLRSDRFSNQHRSPAWQEFIMKHCFAVVTLCMLGFPCAARGEDAALGRKIEQFSLVDTHGKTHTHAEFADRKALVLVTLATECPLARAYAPRMAELAT